VSRPCESCSAVAVELVYAVALCSKCAKAERARIARGLIQPRTMEAAPEVFNLALVDARPESAPAPSPEPILSQPSLF